MTEFHPAANLFPLMDESALAELAADIVTNGLREPIWRHRDGRIIDGRNRWLACENAGVTCHALTYEDDDASIIAFVVSHNLHRRHLTTDQRAAVAADIATMKQGARTDLSPVGGMSQPAAAQLLNVSPKSVERAAAVKRSAPDLHEKVKIGEMKAGAARKEVQKRKPKPEKLRPNALPQKPEALGYLELWLRNGAKMVGKLGDAEQALALADRHRVVLREDEIAIVWEFLSGLFDLTEAARAA